ncbi:MAG: ATP phosphoribosyltransferase [Firmicutes bacterium]|nr:ATP phosphoribosyltransferase [Bacillota bacterium]
MNVNDSLLSYGERLVFELKELYSSCGYTPYRMSKFEEYDLYAENKDFLVSDNVITFTDINGKLMALKPDVTLSIIKNTKDVPGRKQKVYYNENVYRSDKSSGVFREILQTGVECIGDIGIDDVVEVISLAVRSLKAVSPESLLSVSDLSVIEGIIDDAGLSNKSVASVLKAMNERNLNELGSIYDECGLSDDKLSVLKELLSCQGLLNDVLDRLKTVLNNNPSVSGSSDLVDILDSLSDSDVADSIRIDFAVTDDINYYNGIVFKGYVNGIPEAVLSGGRYDRLMKRMNRKACAIGFAAYTGLIEQSGTDSEPADDYINIALPKGRLGEKVYRLFEEAGYDCPEVLEDSRKLLFENNEKKVRYFWVKPADSAVYVERGAADIGVAGKDILLEKEPSVYELLDLNTGICSMTVSAPKDYTDDDSYTLKVATKFPRIARQYYRSRGRDIDIIHLNGSIEIAPLLGLSDVIVDIVETGRTLAENNLEVKETIMPISARLIGNHSSYAFKSELIEKLVNDLSNVVRKNND